VQLSTGDKNMLGNVSDKKAQPFSTSLGVGKDNGGHDPPKKVMLSERLHSMRMKKIGARWKYGVPWYTPFTDVERMLNSPQYRWQAVNLWKFEKQLVSMGKSLEDEANGPN
jgi:hypothetical protein